MADEPEAGAGEQSGALDGDGPEGGGEPGGENATVISTWEDTYSGIPHPPTNSRLAERATVLSTLDQRDQPFYEVNFAG
jgi:hypothetical protein